MIRTLVIPSAIVMAFLFGAATLMATAPELEPSNIKPVPITVRVQNVDMQAIQLKVHSQGSVVPSTISQLIPEVSAASLGHHQTLLLEVTSPLGKSWPVLTSSITKMPEIGLGPR